MGWSASLYKEHHAEVGGVTECVTHFCCMIPGLRQPPLGTKKRGVGRDVSTVLTIDPSCRIHRKAPEHFHVMPLASINLGSHESAVYHGGGLLPAIIDRSTRVMTPGIRAAKGLWNLRRLTRRELLEAKDIPVSLILSMEAFSLPNSFFQDVIPGKSLVFGANRWLHGGGLNNNFSMADNFSIANAVDGAARESALDRGLAGPYAGPHTGPVTVGPSKGLGSLTAESKKSNGPVANDAGPVVGGEGEAIRRLEKENPAQHVLDEIAREKRERKATKSDDAAVPEYLWIEHMLADKAPARWKQVGISAEDIQKALPGLQQLGLRWWKRKVTRSFFGWLRNENGRGKDHSKQSKRQRMSKLKETYVEIEPLEPLKTTEVARQTHPRWRWSNSGLENYQEWWRLQFSMYNKDLDAAADAIARAADSSWWTWDRGSRLFHWRWPKVYQERARDGVPVHFTGRKPEYRTPQRDTPDPKVKESMKRKLDKVRKLGYIAKAFIESLTAFFAVPKGDEDIRMVYDASISGLNDAIWVPRFALPTLETHLRSVDESTYMADIDVGDMFLNFMLHEELRKLCGVDLCHYFPDPTQRLTWEAWYRAAMGMKSSPYQAVQAMGIAMEVIRGDRLDSKNPFQWSKVRLNLPGQRDYDSTQPWVSKRRQDGKIAGDVVSFVDDLRPSGGSKLETWSVARRTASRLNYLGLQDAARKRRDSSQSPGAWAGSVVRTGPDGVFVLVSEDKWIKAKGMLEELSNLLEKEGNTMPRKRLEQIRGYLVHIAQTYPMLRSYLIGLHMTIDSWRPDRDKEGWRMKKANVMIREDEGDRDHDGVWMSVNGNLEAPAVVRAVPRLKHDIRAMQYLMSDEKPTPRRVRSQFAKVYYAFGDASGTSFGFSGAGIGFEDRVDEEIDFDYGQWIEADSLRSSNARELKNLKQSAVDRIRNDGLRDCEIFIFTDNTTAERAYWKGTSKSRYLFDLVLELKKLAADANCIIHLVHVSGKRMIAEGTDGLSRGDHTQGVMAGESIRTYIPLHLTAFQREARLERWWKSTLNGLDFKFLQPEGWFEEAHQHGNYLWTPPPAAADVVVEQLAQARLKRPESMHIVIVPRLMTGRFHRHMSRGTNFWFVIGAADVWNLATHFEPLIVYICFPYISHRPKLREQGVLLEEFRRSVQGSQLPEAFGPRRWNILRKLLGKARKLCSLP